MVWTVFPRPMSSARTTPLGPPAWRTLRYMNSTFQKATTGFRRNNNEDSVIFCHLRGEVGEPLTIKNRSVFESQVRS